MRITVVGCGYVGLVSGTCFSDFGHEVTCVDQDLAKVEALRRGEIPIYEPGLESLVSSNVQAGRLTFSTDLAQSVEGASVVFIAVGTPSRRGDGHADLGYVYQAAREIARAIRDYTVVVTKSTVPVGTGDEVERIMRSERPGIDIAIVSNPEFLREGAAINDFKRPDRIVIGTTDERAREVMAEIYRPLYLNQGPLVFTDRRSSELIKYAANAFLSMKITFINEIADLCEVIGADVQEVARGIGLDKRIGSKFLHAGPGFGGSCFPKDTLALVKIAETAKSPLRLVETTVSVNDERKKRIASRIVQVCGGSVAGKKIAVLGLSFKPNTDDMRDAPSLVIVPMLQAAGAEIVAFDPEAIANARALLPGVAFAKDAYACVAGADALVITTEWDAFRALDLKRVKAIMRGNLVVDLRNIYRPLEMKQRGFAYQGIGHPA
jgi:UDPglucose 6-dehydrogenase